MDIMNRDGVEYNVYQYCLFLVANSVFTQLIKLLSWIFERKYDENVIITSDQIMFNGFSKHFKQQILRFDFIEIKKMDARGFLQLGNTYTKTHCRSSKYIAERRFKSFFGVTPQICCIIWEKIKLMVPIGGEPKHLLWCLSFLKQYAVEHYRRSIFKADEKTIRYWTWLFIKILSNLDVIAWENRFNGSVNGQTCFMSIDGVDFKIPEPKPFNPDYYSHKFKAAGLRYELALNIRTGAIVWVHGGYPCGLYSDLRLAREAFVLLLNVGERAVADKGYKDSAYFILPNAINAQQHKLIMSRHETLNRRLKQFQILKQVFRNDIKKHPMVLHAVANVTQIMFENGHPLFSFTV